MTPCHQVYTLFRFFCIPLLGFLFVMPVTPAMADSSCRSPAFFIEGIEVSARADDAEEARRLAMDDALQQAWSRLINRVLVDPSSALDDNATVGDLVDYVRIDSETVLPQRYLATLTYCFDHDRTRSHFDALGHAHAELVSGSMLVLPVWIIGDTPRIWRRPNPWAEAWMQVMRERDGLVSLNPVRSLATERALTAEEIVSYDREAIATAANLEAAEQVIVTVVTPVLTDSGMNATVHATLFNRDGLRESEFFRRENVAFDVADTEQAMTQLAREIETGLETVWRDVNQVSLRQSGGFTLRVDASSVREWSDQLDLLSGLQPVEELKVIQLDSGGGMVRLLLSSSMRSLTYALETEGLALESREDVNGGQEFVLVPRNR